MGQRQTRRYRRLVLDEHQWPPVLRWLQREVDPAGQPLSWFVAWLAQALRADRDTPMVVLVPLECWQRLCVWLASFGVRAGGPIPGLDGEFFLLSPLDDMEPMSWPPAFPNANPGGSAAPETAVLRPERAED